MRLLLSSLAGLLLPAALLAATPTKPNILYILADDLGYGDVHCFNPDGKIPTPNMDRLAAQGLRFTDAHSGSSVCTPTRYGILTGRYAWRSRLKRGVQGGLSPRLIEPGRLTVAQLLHDHGYYTAAVGKWHLGMDWPRKPGAPPAGDDIDDDADGFGVDYTQPIKGGPNSVGFDYYFGISASLDMVPYTFIENDHAQVVPTVSKSFPMMAPGNNKPTRPGAAAEGFEARDVLPAVERKAAEIITQRAAAKEPFFLYVPLNAPHTPIAPTPEWSAKSQLNAYADYVMETDATVGAILTALESAGIADQTLVILTSDNGCSPMANIPELQAKGHFPNAPWRGQKTMIYEGGHRVPFIVRWPGQVAAGGTTSQLECHTDFLATCADLLGVKLPPTAGEDSVSFLPALHGQPGGRADIVNHSMDGSFAIRQGTWKLAVCPHPGNNFPPGQAAALAKLPPVQLFDLATDPTEKTNLAAAEPTRVQALTALLERQVQTGRSTPGPAQPNTGEVHWQRTLPEILADRAKSNSTP